jgi:prevent-host-death family protein
MRKVSVAQAKAHFSDLVSQARRGKKIVILRHGKPAAAVVPISSLEDPGVAREVMSDRAARAFFESFTDGDPTFDAVGDLLASRR